MTIDDADVEEVLSPVTNPDLHIEGQDGDADISDVLKEATEQAEEAVDESAGAEFHPRRTVLITAKPKAVGQPQPPPDRPAGPKGKGRGRSRGKGGKGGKSWNKGGKQRGPGYDSNSLDHPRD